MTRGKKTKTINTLIQTEWKESTDNFILVFSQDFCWDIVGQGCEACSVALKCGELWLSGADYECQGAGPESAPLTKL